MLKFDFRVVLYLLLSGILGVSLAKDQFYVNFLAWGFLVVQVVDIWTLNLCQAHDWGFEFSEGTIFPHLESGQRGASFMSFWVDVWLLSEHLGFM